jgi:hypothetical protein
VDVELYVQDAPPLLDVIGELPEPRIAELDALLREVEGLRSSLRRDLGLAATAAEAGEDDLAGWLLLGEDGEIRSFQERALGHLARLETSETSETAEIPAHSNPDEAAAVVVPAPRRYRRMMPAAPLVAACAAVFGFLTGVVPTPTSSPGNTNNVAFDESFAKFSDLALNGASDRRIREAAEQFHADLAPLVADAQTNPAAAAKALALLEHERSVLASTAPNSAALQAVLRQADILVRRLQASMPKKPLHRIITVPAPQQKPGPSQRPSNTKSSPTPKASPNAFTSPGPSPWASPSPKASPSSRSSASPSPAPSNPLGGNPAKGPVNG